MKGKAAGAIVSLAIMTSCGGGSQGAENAVENVTVDYGTAVDASAPSDETADNTAIENKADAIEGPDRSRPDSDVTLRNKQN